MDFHASDLSPSRLLVVLEGLLSADNALVLAILVLGLPRDQQQKALRYGILGAFVFRILATLLAVHLIQLGWVKLIGGALPAVPAVHALLRPSGGAEERRAVKPATPWLGLSARSGPRSSRSS